MGKFTYELGNVTQKLETYEWDNNWIEHATRDDINRILYIGDSISCGTREIATKMADGKYYFDGVGTSKAVDNPYLMPTVSLFGEQQRARKIVLFNNGLHGGHLSADEYAECYEEIVKALLEEFKGTPVALVLSTFVNTPEEEKVEARNAKVKEIAEKYELPIIDLFSVAKANSDKLSPDGVHFTKSGYEQLAAEILKRLDEILA